MESLHISEWRPNIAIIWNIIDGMSIIHPEIKGQLVRVFVVQNIFRLDVWVLGVIVEPYDWSTETPNIVESPQSLLVIEILELTSKSEDETVLGMNE